METANGKIISTVDSIIYENKIYDFCVANTKILREQSFRFLYEIYLNGGLGLNNKNKFRLWFSISELLPDTITLVVFCEDKIVGSVSIIPDSEIGLPVDKAYKKEMDKKRKNGNVLCEVFSLGIHPSIRGKRPVIGKLFNHIYLVSKYIQETTHWIIEVIPKHESFYRHSLLFKSEGSISFHKKTGVYCKLLSHRLDLFSEVDDKDIQKTFMKYYLPNQSDEELNVVFNLREQVDPIKAEEVYYFIDKCPNVINDLTKSEKDRFFNSVKNAEKR